MFSIAMIYMSRTPESMNTEAGQKVTVLTKIDMNKENIDIIYVVFKHIEHV